MKSEFFGADWLLIITSSLRPSECFYVSATVCDSVKDRLRQVMCYLNWHSGIMNYYVFFSNQLYS